MNDTRIICSIFLVLFVAMELFLRRGATAKSLRTQPTDRGTTVLIFICYGLAVLSLSVPTVGPGAPLWLRWLGVWSCAAGTVLRVWAMRTLGEYYTRTLVTQSGQPVIQHGPYRLVRHPGYLSAMMIWIGAAVSSGRGMAILTVGLLLAIAYVYRITTEERMLVTALGVDYERYRQRSWRLIPFVY
jgi:protein-S-isoprenylcysteine O-methyltransferase